jgi:hypothetical protein
MIKQKRMDSSSPLFVAPVRGSVPSTSGRLVDAVGQFCNMQAIFRRTELATHMMAWRRVTGLIASVQEFKASTLDPTNSMERSPCFCCCCGSFLLLPLGAQGIRETPRFTSVS